MCDAQAWPCGMLMVVVSLTPCVMLLLLLAQRLMMRVLLTLRRWRGRGGLMLCGGM